MTSRAITSESLGSWVIKCNPRVTDIEPMVAAGRATERWCVANNYRSRLMAAGQPVLFWVSAHPQRGIWGAGTLTGPAEPGPKWTVPTGIVLFDEPVVASSLSAVHELAGMEVFRSPQQSNPSWVDKEAWAVVRGLLPGKALRDGASRLGGTGWRGGTSKQVSGVNRWLREHGRRGRDDTE